jgi:diaminobutyrate-2-oxoglutarate transaminase
MRAIEAHESRVRSYCRTFPTTFQKGRGATLTDVEGRSFLDFFSGAGALNYGHNPPRLKRALVDYLESDGVTHSLDMATVAKEELLERFHDVVLAPRGLDHRVQFPGPTGTNAVEAALKLARKATGRSTVIAFTNAFHGMTLGSLAVTGNGFKRAGAGVRLDGVVRAPYDGYLGEGIDTLAWLERALDDPGSGLGPPAAAIVETVQGEGGLAAASGPWLRGLAELLRRHEALLIVDDVQVGCGRTGPFFSFEPFGLRPDVVCLSKSISGYGLPMALTLIRPELDVWEPGEHVGTFRGHVPAFVTATAALSFWEDDDLTRQVEAKAALVRARLQKIVDLPGTAATGVRGRGLIQGLRMDPPELAAAAAAECFRRGVILETSGPRDEVLKLLPPLVIEEDSLRRGLDVIEDAVAAVGARGARGARGAAAARGTV